MPPERQRKVHQSLKRATALMGSVRFTSEAVAPVMMTSALPAIAEDDGPPSRPSSRRLVALAEDTLAAATSGRSRSSGDESPRPDSVRVPLPAPAPMPGDGRARGSVVGPPGSAPFPFMPGSPSPGRRESGEDVGKQARVAPKYGGVEGVRAAAGARALVIDIAVPPSLYDVLPATIRGALINITPVLFTMVRAGRTHTRTHAHSCT